MRSKLVVMAVLSGWMACSPAAPGQVPAAPPPLVADADRLPIPEAKLNQYIKGYNSLIGTFGLPDQSRLYATQHIATRTGAGFVNVAPGWIVLGDDDLRMGQAVDTTGLPEVDAAVADMVPILDRLVERLKGLEAYYGSRGQLEDNFARGKREDPLVLADFKAALAALGPLDAALEHAIERRDTAHLAVLKERGDLVGFNGGLAVQRAKRLLGLVHTAADLHDPAVVAKADELADGILAALAEEGTALETAKASGDSSNALRNSMFGTAMGQLQGMVGAWRDMKRTGNVALRPAMVGAYNMAIRNINVGN